MPSIVKLQWGASGLVSWWFLSIWNDQEQGECVIIFAAFSYLPKKYEKLKCMQNMDKHEYRALCSIFMTMMNMNIALDSTLSRFFET